MCGGAIIADLIPRHRSLRLTASDLWPDSICKENQQNVNEQVENPVKRQGKNLCRGIRQHQWGKWAAEIRNPRKVVPMKHGDVDLAGVPVSASPNACACLPCCGFLQFFSGVSRSAPPKRAI